MAHVLFLMHLLMFHHILSSQVALPIPNPFALRSCTSGRVGVLQHDYSLVLHTEWEGWRGPLEV